MKMIRKKKHLLHDHVVETGTEDQVRAKTLTLGTSVSTDSMSYTIGFMIRGSMTEVLTDRETTLIEDPETVTKLKIIVLS